MKHLLLMLSILTSSIAWTMEGEHNLLLSSINKAFREQVYNFSIAIDEKTIHINTHDLSDSLQLRNLYQRLKTSNASLQDNITLWTSHLNNQVCMMGTRSCPPNYAATVESLFVKLKTSDDAICSLDIDFDDASDAEKSLELILSQIQ